MPVRRDSPAASSDAAILLFLTRPHLQAIRGAVSLEQPLRDLGAWLRKAGPER